jgi:hypothetical protein
MRWRRIQAWFVHALATPLAIAGVLIAGFMAAVVVAFGVQPGG